MAYSPAKRRAKYLRVREKDIARESARYHQTRARCFIVLGGEKCVRCGFIDTRALVFDHKNGDGYKDRGLNSHARLKKVLQYPELFQVLCANCNSIKRIENNEHARRRIFGPLDPHTAARNGSFHENRTLPGTPTQPQPSPYLSPYQT
jgi:hypothetical protein